MLFYGRRYAVDALHLPVTVQIDIDGKIRRILFGGKTNIQRLPEPVRRDAVTFQVAVIKTELSADTFECAAERHHINIIIFQINMSGRPYHFIEVKRDFQL